MLDGLPCPDEQGPLLPLSSQAMFWAASFQMLIARTTVFFYCKGSSAFVLSKSGVELCGLSKVDGRG